MNSPYEPLLVWNNYRIKYKKNIYQILSFKSKYSDIVSADIKILTPNNEEEIKYCYTDLIKSESKDINIILDYLLTNAPPEDGKVTIIK